jgi:hypothetical protein
MRCRSKFVWQSTARILLFSWNATYLKKWDVGTCQVRVSYTHVRCFPWSRLRIFFVITHTNISISAARMCYARPVCIAVMAKQNATGYCQLFLRYQLLMLHNLQLDCRTDEVRTEPLLTYSRKIRPTVIQNGLWIPDVHLWRHTAATLR